MPIRGRASVWFCATWRTVQSQCQAYETYKARDTAADSVIRWRAIVRNANCELGGGNRTRGVRQFILPALDLVLETLRLAPGRGNFGLHLFAAHVGHGTTLEPLTRMESSNEGRARESMPRGVGLSRRGMKEDGDWKLGANGDREAEATELRPQTEHIIRREGGRQRGGGGGGWRETEWAELGGKKERERREREGFDRRF